VSTKVSLTPPWKTHKSQIAGGKGVGPHEKHASQQLHEPLLKKRYAPPSRSFVACELASSLIKTDNWGHPFNSGPLSGG